MVDLISIISNYRRYNNDTMVTVYDHDKHGNRIVVCDSRLRYPELLGYAKDSKHGRGGKTFLERFCS